MDQLQLLQSKQILESPFTKRFVEFAQELSKSASEVLDIEGISWRESVAYKSAFSRENLIHLDDTTHLLIFQERNFNDDVPFVTEIVLHEGVTRENLDIDDSPGSMLIHVYMDGVDNPEGVSAKDSYCKVERQDGTTKLQLSLSPGVTQTAADYFKHYTLILQAYKDCLLQEKIQSRALVE